MKGAAEGLTESFFTLISEDMEKKWLPSVVLRANKDFSAVPMTTDKCLTEGYSPSCVILMICSRHTPISLVVHEALRHTQHSAPSVRAQSYVVGPPFFCRSQLWRPTKKNTYICFVVFLQAALHNRLILQQLRLSNDDGLSGPRTV